MKELLLSLIPAALKVIEALVDGDADLAEQRSKALAQAIALKKLTREAAK